MVEYLIKKETLEATADEIRSCINGTPAKYSFISSVDDGNGRFIENSVTIGYYEYVDYNGSNYNKNIPEGKQNDGFIAYDYLPNNEGIIVPVIYKANVTITDPEDEYYGADYEDTFFYEGEEFIDGQNYNKWRKIEIGDTEFGWDKTAKQYVYTNIIVANNEISPVDFPSKVREVYEAGAISGDMLRQITDRSVTNIDLTHLNNLTSIGAYAYCQCTNLISIVIPKEVTTIGEYAFYNCPKLTTVYYTGSVEDWANVVVGDGNEQLVNSLCYYSATNRDNDAYWCWRYVNGIPTPWEGQISRGLEYTLLDDGTYSVTGIGTCNDTCIVLPESYNGVSVTTIGERAFRNNQNITNFVVSDSVSTIDAYAFSDCNSLTSIEIPNSVTSIGSSAFEDCISLTSIVIPDSVISISYNAFYRCESLASITIPDSVTSISYNAFYGCESLASITVPDSVTSIGYQAFYGCTSLTSIIIGNGVTSIGDYAFYNCPALATVYYGGARYYDISSDWDNITIGSYNEALNNATRIYSTEITEDYYVYTINNDWTAYGCIGVDKNFYAHNSDIITISNTIRGIPVTWISDNAFEDHNEHCVIIGDNVAHIGDYAFYGCSNLSNVTIPVSVITIGYDAFYDFVYNGGEFTYQGNAIQWNAISKSDEATVLASVKFLAPLPTYTDEQGITYESSSDNSYYVCSSAAGVSEPNITIADYISGIPVKEIGACAFDYNTSTHSVVETVIIPNTVEIIGEAAFAALSPDESIDPFEVTSNLTTVVIPDSVTTIGDYAFYYCTSLESIVIPDSVITIGDFAFGTCVRMSQLDLGNSVQTIGCQAFSSLGAMAEFSEPFVINIPDSVIEIGDDAFYSSAISEVIFGANSRLDTINDYTFAYCNSLYHVALPNSLISIGVCAFGDCENLTDITIPSFVVSIDTSAFSGTPVTIYVPWSEGQVANAPWGTSGEIYYDYY